MCLLKSLKITNFIPTLCSGPRVDCFEIIPEQIHSIKYDLCDIHILSILTGIFNIYKKYGTAIFCANSFIDKEKNIQLSVIITLDGEDYEYILSIKYNHNSDYNTYSVESEILKIDNDIILNIGNTPYLTIFDLKENVKVSKFISFIKNIIIVHSLVIADKNIIVDTYKEQSVKLDSYNFLNWFYYEFSIMPKLYINLLSLSNNMALDYKFNIIDKYKKELIIKNNQNEWIPFNDLKRNEKLFFIYTAICSYASENKNILYVFEHIKKNITEIEYQILTKNINNIFNSTENQIILMS